MKITDIPQDLEPRVGDIIEIEQGEDCFEVRIIGITADGYLCEQDNVQGAVLLEGTALDHSDVADIMPLVEGLRDPKDNPCWKGYHPVGTKKKNGRTVPNCVPNAKEGVEEAGPFSYGAKKPRRGSVADLADKKRREQEKNRPPIEPKDQMVGTAKLTKDVSETSDYFRRREREEAIISGQKPARKKQPAQTSDYARRREQEKKAEKGVAEGFMKSLAIKLLDKKTPQEVANSAVSAINKKASGTKMHGHPNFVDFKREVHRYVSAADSGSEAVRRSSDDHVKSLFKKYFSEGVAEGSLNEFAPDGFGGDDGDGFDPDIAKMAQEDGIRKGASLADGATLERAMAIEYWHSRDGGMYKQYFAKGFKQGRMNKIKHDNKQYNLNLKLMKDGSIRHSEQGVAEGVGGWSGPLYDPALQGTGKKQRYEMMFKNGQVKRFSAMNDNEARKIAAGHGAKSVIKMKGNVPGDKIAEQGVAEGIMKSLASRLVKGAANRQTPQEIANTHVRALNQRAPGTRMQGHPNFADFKREVHSYISAAQNGEQAFARTTDDHVKSLFKKYFSEGVAEGYTGRETKDGTWHVFKDGQAVAVAGPFNSRDEAHAWIKKHKQGVSEAKSLKKRVRVVQGEHAGKTGWIREIKHGIHSTAPKRYYVDIDGGGQADNLPASALRLLKNQSDSQKGMAEGGYDDQFSLSGKMPATDRIPQDSTQHQDRQLAMGDKIKQQTIAYILNLRPEFERSDLELATTPELIQMLRDIQSGKMTEAEYQGRKVPLGKPMAGDVKKSKVYVRKPNGRVVKVNFGDKNMTIKKSNPKRRKSFRARHNCANPGPRWRARYWSCRAW